MLEIAIIGKDEKLLDQTLMSLIEVQDDLFSSERITICASKAGLSEEFKQQYGPLNVKLIDIADAGSPAYRLNRCIAHLDPISDILLLSEGSTVKTTGFIKLIEDALESSEFSNYGVLCPVMLNEKHFGNLISEYPAPLQTVIIRRDAWLASSAFDLSFGTSFYMFMDFYRKVVQANWRIGVLNSVVIEAPFVAQQMDQMKFKQDVKVFNERWGEGHYLGEYEPRPDDWSLGEIKDTETPVDYTIEKFNPSGFDNAMKATGYGQDLDKLREEQKTFHIAGSRILMSSPFISIDEEGFQRSEPDEENLDSLYVDSAMRFQLLSQYRAPEIIKRLAKNTDFEADAELLYALIHLIKPHKIMLCGATQSALVKIVSRSSGRLRVPSKITGIDASDRAGVLLKSNGCQFIKYSVVDYPSTLSARERLAQRSDFIILDIDPHTYSQTEDWLDNWIPQMLNPGGFVVFHDIIENRPEIQVKEAVRDWVSDKEGWKWIEFEALEGNYQWPQGGIGLLSAPKEEED